MEVRVCRGLEVLSIKLAGEVRGHITLFTMCFLCNDGLFTYCNYLGVSRYDLYDSAI